MEWNRGYSANYYLAIVDHTTWRDVERVEITGGNIDREDEGLLHSADVDCTDFPYNGETYVRIYLDARQAGQGELVPLFTGLATTPDDDYDGERKTNKVQCYSVLKAAADVLLPRGWYAPAGISADVILHDLLSVIPAPVDVAENAPTLKSSIVASDEDSVLDMAQTIVTAVNWHMSITGDGRVVIAPYEDEARVTFDPLANDCIETEISVSHDWYGCPNVFRAIDETLTAIARDDSEDSPLSTINRGREVWMQDTSCDLADNESIGQYAIRRLREEQRNALVATYKRRFYPDIYPGDRIYMKYPKQGVNGLFRVKSQTIELGKGATTSEEITND